MNASTEEKKEEARIDDLKYRIEIATQTLERNIGFVTNCDNKTSVILSVIGVLLAIVLTNDGLLRIFSIVCSCIEAKTPSCNLYLFCLAVAASIMFSGMYNLVNVLIAKTSVKANGLEEVDSMIFFTGIRKHIVFKDYHSKFNTMTNEDLLKDLVRQIYINADIASRKYRKYNCGVKLTLIGFLLDRKSVV